MHCTKPRVRSDNCTVGAGLIDKCSSGSFRRAMPTCSCSQLGEDRRGVDRSLCSGRRHRGRSGTSYPPTACSSVNGNAMPRYHAPSGVVVMFFTGAPLNCLKTGSRRMVTSLKSTLNRMASRAGSHANGSKESWHWTELCSLPLGRAKFAECTTSPWTRCAFPHR